MDYIIGRVLEWISIPYYLSIWTCWLSYFMYVTSYTTKCYIDVNVTLISDLRVNSGFLWEVRTDVCGIYLLYGAGEQTVKNGEFR